MQLPQAPDQTRARGRLRLRFERAPGNPPGDTSVRVCEHRPPLQIVRAFPLPGGGALVHLHNLSGGVLSGDHLEVALEIGPRAFAQVTSTGATRVYRSRKEASAALQVNEVSVEEQGLLEYLPDPIIPFAGSRYRQQTRIELAGGAGLFWWETIAPGREARGELFEYELFESTLDLAAGGKPIALERLRLEPAVRPLSSPARLGPHRYWATLYVCRAGETALRWVALEKQLAELATRMTRPSEVLWGVSTLPADGLVVRALSMSGRDLATGLPVFWQAAKRALYDQDAVPPRKTY